MTCSHPTFDAPSSDKADDLPALTGLGTSAQISLILKLSPENNLSAAVSR